VRNRLVVERPIHHVAIARLLQQIEGVVGLGDVRREPACRFAALVLLDRCRGLEDARPLLLAAHVRLALGVRAAVPDDLVPAFTEGRDELGAVVVELGIDEQRIRDAVAIGELQQPPCADPVAEVPPRIAARVGLRMGRRIVVAQSLAESEVLDVEAEMDGQPLPVGPGVVGATADR
jgi:hypothetical protein